MTVKRWSNAAEGKVMFPVSLVLHRLNPWMDLEAAADYSGVAYAELLAAAAQGLLPATRHYPKRPGDWMVTMDDVDVWAETRRKRVSGPGVGGAAPSVPAPRRPRPHSAA